MRNTLQAFISKVSGLLALIGAIGVLAMLVHITAYVIMRHVVASPIPATVEIVSSYYMVLIAFLPIAWAESRGDMIAVEVIGQFFKGRVKAANAAFVALITTAAYVVLTYTTWIVAMREFSSKSYVISLSFTIPIWPSYFILPISFALASLVALSKFLMAGTDLIRPTNSDTDKSAGISS